MDTFFISQHTRAANRTGQSSLLIALYTFSTLISLNKTLFVIILSVRKEPLEALVVSFIKVFWICEQVRILLSINIKELIIFISRIVFLEDTFFNFLNCFCKEQYDYLN